MIKQIVENKKQFLDLLLLADEQESMIDTYLEKGEMFALYEEEAIRATCVVVDQGKGVIEIKNIATVPSSQKQGYGKKLINYIENRFSKSHTILTVGTGDSPLTVPFYEKCGFTQTHRIANFFIDNYDHPIIEEGRQLVDMVYFEKTIKK